MTAEHEGVDIWTAARRWFAAKHGTDPDSPSTYNPGTAAPFTGTEHPYVGAALDGACSDIAAMTDHDGRNNAVNAQLFRFCGFAAAGHLQESRAVAAIRDAAMASGLAGLELRRLLRTDATGAIAAGRTHPQDPPPRREPAPLAVAPSPEDFPSWAPDGVDPATGEIGASPEQVQAAAAERRAAQMLAQELATQRVRRAARLMLDEEERAAEAEAARGLHRFRDGADYVLTQPDTPPSVWGAGQQVLWAQGESLIIVAGNGAGKTTLAAQLVRARLGLATAVLGQPVATGTRRVLYLAMDRPRQIARAMGRIFTPDEADVLRERLTVWQGPPPLDLARHPEVLAELCANADADTVVVDSVKDAAIGLSEDEVGAGWNRARQTAIAAGVEILELHHNVKRGVNGAEPSSIADVYGSVWITGGAGSVILLSGAPGDPVVGLRHLKQPAEEFGPHEVIHVGGWSHLQEEKDVRRALAGQPLTAVEIAAYLFDKASPVAAEIEKARRKVQPLLDDGTVIRGGGRSGGAGGAKAHTYRLANPDAVVWPVPEWSPDPDDEPRGDAL